MKPDPRCADPGSLTGAGCGCLFWTQDDAFVARPCSEGCELYTWVRGELLREGKPVVYYNQHQ